MRIEPVWADNFEHSAYTDRDLNSGVLLMTEPLKGKAECSGPVPPYTFEQPASRKLQQ